MSEKVSISDIYSPRYRRGSVNVYFLLRVSKLVSYNLLNLY